MLVSLPAAAEGSAQETPFVQEFPNGANFAFPTKPLSGYDADGIASGDFLLKGAVSSGAVYDSNVLRTNTRPLQDYIFFVAPSFDLTRDGGRHTEELTVSVSNANYAVSDADNFTNIFARANETYLLSASSRIVVNAFFADGYERRVSSNHDIPTDAADPVHLQILQGGLGYVKSWQNYDAGVNFTFSNRSYDDVKSITGTLLDQTYRDNNDYVLDAFFNLALSQHISSRLTFSASSADFYNDQLRSVNELKISDFTNVEITSKTSIGVTVALKGQDFYNSPAAQLLPLLQYEALLQWQPTQRLSFSARGGYHDLGVDFVTGIGGGFGQYGALDFKYRIWRNLMLTSTVRFEKINISSITSSVGILSPIAGRETESIFGTRAGLTYEFSSHAGMSFLYNLDKLESHSTSFVPYNENIFQASLNLRF